MSERGISLVYQGLQASLKHKILTVESYIKWYDIYTVDPQGNVEVLPYKYIEAYDAAFPEQSAWADHIPSLQFCKFLVTQYQDEFEWDIPSYEMIVGRMMVEGRMYVEHLLFQPGRPLTNCTKPAETK
jgi:hypothetical protein